MNQFNSGVKYKGKKWKWGTVILNKTQELTRFLLRDSHSTDFMEPAPRLGRSDSRNLRKLVLELTQREAERLGIGRNTLHYLRGSSKNRSLFRVYGKTLSRLRCEQRALACATAR